MEASLVFPSVANLIHRVYRVERRVDTLKFLANAVDICLVSNSSVNAYRRLDPNFEAPNEITASAVNRAAMVRWLAASSSRLAWGLRSRRQPPLPSPLSTSL